MINDLSLVHYKTHMISPPTMITYTHFVSATHTHSLLYTHHKKTATLLINTAALHQAVVRPLLLLLRLLRLLLLWLLLLLLLLGLQLW
jgi:hypothetical protein